MTRQLTIIAVTFAAGLALAASANANPAAGPGQEGLPAAPVDDRPIPPGYGPGEVQVFASDVIGFASRTLGLDCRDHEHDPCASLVRFASGVDARRPPRRLARAAVLERRHGARVRCRPVARRPLTKCSSRRLGRLVSYHASWDRWGGSIALARARP